MAGTPRLRNNYFCGNCDGCQRKEDCGECKFCRDKPKFGGPNRLKKKCEERVCINKTPVVTDPKTKKLVQKCLGMKCTNQIPIKTRSKKPKRNPDDSDFRDGVEFGLWALFSANLIEFRSGHIMRPIPSPNHVT